MAKASARTLRAQLVSIAASTLPPPRLTYDVERKRWVVDEAYEYVDGSTRITVPGGFLSDLSSVPHFLWSVIAPFELSIVAPLVHDLLYRHGGAPPPELVHPYRTWTRSEADGVFGRIMEQEGIARWRRVLAGLAVRAFGGSHWKEAAPGAGAGDPGKGGRPS